LQIFYYVALDFFAGLWDNYVSDFDTAGQALNWVVDQYPDKMIELTVTSLPAYEKEYA